MAGARTASAQTAAGTVSTSTGQVHIGRGGTVLAAKTGTPVDQGDEIYSGADGRAVIILTDQSKLVLGPSTAITLDQYNGGGATPTRVGLVSGTMRSVVKGTSNAPANYQVHTANAIVTVRGTDFYTAYTPNSPQLGNLPGVSHYTEVDVIDGIVKLAQASEPGNGFDVGPGTSGTVAGDKPPKCHERKYDRDRCDRDCDHDLDRDRDHDVDHDRVCHQDCHGDRDCDRNCDRDLDRDRDHDRDRDRDCHRCCDHDRDRDCEPDHDHDRSKATP